VAHFLLSDSPGAPAITALPPHSSASLRPHTLQDHRLHQMDNASSPVTSGAMADTLRSHRHIPYDQCDVRP